MAEWWSIEVFSGDKLPASGWRYAYEDELTEAAITHGAMYYEWHDTEYGVIFEVLFRDDARVGGVPRAAGRPGRPRRGPRPGRRADHLPRPGRRVRQPQAPQAQARPRRGRARARGAEGGAAPQVKVPRRLRYNGGARDAIDEVLRELGVASRAGSTSRIGARAPTPPGRGARR